MEKGKTSLQHLIDLEIDFPGENYKYTHYMCIDVRTVHKYVYTRKNTTNTKPTPVKCHTYTTSIGCRCVRILSYITQAYVHIFPRICTEQFRIHARRIIARATYMAKSERSTLDIT